jgi:hypothetical protein
MKTSIILLVVALLSTACRSTSLAAGGNVVSLADTAIMTSGGKADVAVALHAESLPALDLTLDVVLVPRLRAPTAVVADRLRLHPSSERSFRLRNSYPVRRPV